MGVLEVGIVVRSGEIRGENWELGIMGDRYMLCSIGVGGWHSLHGDSDIDGGDGVGPHVLQC